MRLRLLAQAANAVVLIAFAVLLPVSPLLMAGISGDTAYLRRYRQTLQRSWRMFRTMAASGVVARNLLRSWQSRQGIAARMEGACTHCGNCCIHRQCVFLRFDGAGRSQCSIYDNLFWRLTSCGTYPIHAADIEVYACPSFRVIDIRPAGPAD